MLYPVASQQPTYCRCFVLLKDIELGYHEMIFASTFASLRGVYFVCTTTDLCGFPYGRNDDLMQCHMGSSILMKII
ncbi:hypothetical protein T06_3393 [Trichinella sp. T6]|nr:hypothetical protein T06_3393 [Trichinella sp. T6]